MAIQGPIPRPTATRGVARDRLWPGAYPPVRSPQRTVTAPEAVTVVPAFTHSVNFVSSLVKVHAPLGRKALTFGHRTHSLARPDWARRNRRRPAVRRTHKHGDELLLRAPVIDAPTMVVILRWLASRTGSSRWLLRL